MKLALNKKGKVVVIAKKGKRQTIKKKLTSYERYLVKAKELKVDYVLTEGEYYATVRFNREKGRKNARRQTVEKQNICNTKQ